MLGCCTGCLQLLCLESVMSVSSLYNKCSSAFGFAEGLFRQERDTLFLLFHCAVQTLQREV